VSQWSVFELGVVRAAGFGFGLVDELADPELYRLALDHGVGRAELDKAADEFLDSVKDLPRPRDPDERRIAERCLRAVARRTAFTEAPSGLGEFQSWWNAWCAEFEQNTQLLTDRYPDALTRARKHLDRVLRDEDVRTALVLLTPEILNTTIRSMLRRPPAGPAPNQAERKAVAFLQRLATKCETNGPAGPIGYAAMGTNTVPLPQDAERRGYLAFRVAATLARESLRRTDLTGRPVRPGPLAAQVPPGRIPPATPKNLRALHDRGLVVVDELTLPVSEPDALAALTRFATRANDPVLSELVLQLSEIARKFADGDAETKTRILAEANVLLAENGVDVARRGMGELYADRVALYQENHDDRLDLRFDAQATASLTTRLAPVLKLAAVAGVHAWQHARHEFDRGFGEPTMRPLPEVLRTLNLHLEAPVSDTPIAAAFSALVAKNWDGQAPAVRLEPDEVHALLPEIDAEHPVLLSPDIHLDAGNVDQAMELDCPLVVGELHWGLQGLGNLCCLLPDRDRLVSAAQDWLAGTELELVHVATKERFGKLCYLELFPRTLELSGAAAATPLAADSLDVGRDGTVTERATGRRIALLLGDPEGRLQCPLGVPSAALPRVDLGGFTPRISVGDVVVQRASWRADPYECDGPPGLPRYLALVSRLSDMGVPRRCFATFKGERKPLYLDLASPHLVDLVATHWSRAPVRLTEMLPDPAGLWQPAGDDRRVCELRLATALSRGVRPRHDHEEPTCPSR
jgi:hypothetical protein